MQLEQRAPEDSSSGLIMRLVPVFSLETNNQTNNECLPKFVQSHIYNASSSIKTAIDTGYAIFLSREMDLCMFFHNFFLHDSRA